MPLNLTMLDNKKVKKHLVILIGGTFIFKLSMFVKFFLKTEIKQFNVYICPQFWNVRLSHKSYY